MSLTQRSFIIQAAVLCIVSCLSLSVSGAFVGIYINNAVYPTNNPNAAQNIANIKKSSYTSAILWTIHVTTTGDLIYNDYLIISNGAYIGESKWPGYVNSLLQTPTNIQEVWLSVGSGGETNKDFTNIQSLIKANGSGPNSVLYKHFKLIRTLMPVIKGIVFDDEDRFDVSTTVSFGNMLSNIGFQIAFCPYNQQSYWIESLRQLGNKVTQVHLQCYAGGGINMPAQWQASFKLYGITTPLYPGEWGMEVTPAQAQQNFDYWRRTGSKGGWMFLYDEILKANVDPNAYALAIKNGLKIK